MAHEPGKAAPTPLPRLRYIQSGSTLPQPIAPFVGREREIEAIQALLADPGMRLLTFVGPGGVGKTRLALQSVTGMPDVLQRAIHFVPLAAVRSSPAILNETANALDASDGGARPLIESIRAALRDRPTLIILDNLEHLLPDAAGIVAELLEACASLNILTTSRSPLRINGERRFPVHPLPVSVQPGHALASSGHEAPEAVRLFMLRAQAVDPDLHLTASTRKDITDICRRLDGLPLAIELAAARVAELPPRAYLQRLERNLPLPESGSRDMPARQQTMSAVVRWGYDLLEPAWQAMFRRMAVFAGEFDLEAAEAMATDIFTESPADHDAASLPLDLLLGLVEASLVHRRTDATGEPWYQMLETIRGYGLKAAVAEGESEVLHRRHAGYYLDQVIRANEELLAGRRVIHWLRIVDGMLSNIRSAMEWAAIHEPLLLAQFTRNLMQYWLRRSRIREGIDWLMRARDVAAGLPEGDRGWILTNLGRLHQYTPGSDANAYFQDASGIALATNDREIQLAIFVSQALHGAKDNRLDDAWAAFNGAMSIPDVQQIVPRVTQPTFLSAIEVVLTGASGDLDRAEEMAERALARARHAQDDTTPCLLHRILGVIERERGNLELARTHALTALETYDSFDEGWNVANCLMDLAKLFVRDHPDLSMRLAGAADRLLAVHGAQPLDADPQVFQAWTDDLRERIGEDALRALWSEGASQSWRTLLETVRTTPVDRQAGRPMFPGEPHDENVRHTLSRREREVLRLIADGLTDREIAEALGLSYRTITTYVSNILTKLDVPSRAGAVNRAARDGILDG